MAAAAGRLADERDVRAVQRAAARAAHRKQSRAAARAERAHRQLAASRYVTGYFRDTDAAADTNEGRIDIISSETRRTRPTRKLTVTLSVKAPWAAAGASYRIAYRHRGRTLGWVRAVRQADGAVAVTAAKRGKDVSKHVQATADGGQLTFTYPKLAGQPGPRFSYVITTQFGTFTDQSHGSFGW